MSQCWWEGLWFLSFAECHWTGIWETKPVGADVDRSSDPALHQCLEMLPGLVRVAPQALHKIQNSSAFWVKIGGEALAGGCWTFKKGRREGKGEANSRGGFLQQLLTRAAGFPGTDRNLHWPKAPPQGLLMQFCIPTALSDTQHPTACPGKKNHNQVFAPSTLHQC